MPEQGIPHIDNVEAYLAERQAWMNEAVYLLTGERDPNPREVFAERTMDKENVARADTVGLELTEEQERGLREIAGRFGIGGHQDVESGADHQVEEGGKPWKVEAQLAISVAEGTKSITMLGWPGRRLGLDETGYLKQKFGRTTDNEYDMVRQMVEAQPGFEPLADEVVMPFGYDIHDNHSLVEGETGQLKHIGHLNGIPVLLARIDNDWVDVVDEESGETKRQPRNRPDAAAMMLFISKVLEATGEETSSVGFNTSNTYASKAIDTVLAGLQADRSFTVGMYGRETLHSTIDETVEALKSQRVDEKQIPKVPADTPINQLPSEMGIIYDKLVQLEAELQNR